ncbi:Oxidoreductase BOA17 like protein [Verticillium longisporum]|uniref:Oxidoreductase BOA17 like protein n=1 Tax=Verticillium longisporum TaxID=100787 RepID=A0A8I3ANF4_VERLO|nr:Oxidoreductase BOA17 like protein [Verticillium longisporum]
MDISVWFITGASSGFGFEIAKVALARSHKVIATARNTTKLARLADLGATVIPLDVTAPESTIRAALAEAHGLHGQLTHVVNSAGYVLDGAVEECTADEVAAMYATNVLGTHKVTRAAAPYLRAQGAGVVANFGSLGSWELGPFGVDVCVVEPGYFRTGFLNAGARLHAEERLGAYRDGPAAEKMADLDRSNDNQAGDPVKAAEVIVDVLTRSGMAEGRAIPLRLVLGTDCLATVRQKCKDTVALLDEWQAVSASTDFVV